MMTFYRGQRVVCVNAGPDPFGLPARLRLNAVYTIMQTGIYGGDPVVHLNETSCNYGVGFCATRFRPAVEQKRSTETGMAILRRALEPKLEEVSL